MPKRPTHQLVDVLNEVWLDRTGILDIAIAISEQHARICTEIGKCGDMDEATRLSQMLEGLKTTFDTLNSIVEKVR